MANLPPNRDEFSEDLEYQLAYDQWAYEITQDVNSGEVGGGGTVTSEVDDQGQTVLGGVPQGYQLRYLDTAYATSADGANISPAISALPADRTETWQLVRNIDNEVESLTPADFSARLVSSAPSAAQRAYYRLRTGGQVPNWVFAEEQPIGFVEDLGTSVIDLDAVTSFLFEVNSIDEYNQVVAIANIGDRLYTANDLTDPSASETQTYTFETPTDFLFSGFPYASLTSATAGVTAIQDGTANWFTQLDNGNVLTTAAATNGATIAAFVFSTTTQNDPTILALAGETGFVIMIGASANTYTVDSVEQLGAGGTANFVYRLNLTNTDSNVIPNYNISSGASFQANVVSTVDRTFTTGDLRNPIAGTQGFITFSYNNADDANSELGAGTDSDGQLGFITRVQFSEPSGSWVDYTGINPDTLPNPDTGTALGIFDSTPAELIFGAQAGSGNDGQWWLRGDFTSTTNEPIFSNADVFEGPSIDAGFYTFDGLFFLPDGGDSTVTNTITTVEGNNVRLDIAYFDDAAGTNPAYPLGLTSSTTYFPADRGDRNFQGTNVVFWIDVEPAVSQDPADYEIAQLTGDTGAQGSSVEIFFAYANTDDGLNEADDANDASFSTTYFADALYIGTDAVSHPVGVDPVRSTDATSYEWARLRGEDGMSITGPGGSSNRIDFAYFFAADGSLEMDQTNAFPSGTMQDDDYVAAVRGEREFLGTNVVTWIAGETEPDPSTTVSDYEILPVIGERGDDGLSTQLYFAYADTDDGLNEADTLNDASFSTTYFTDALYVGTDAVTYPAGTTVPVQSTDATTYEWSRLRGEDGIIGPGGSANRIDVAYFDAADGTDPVYPTGTLADDDYVLATRGTRQFQGTNVVTWIAGETEPEVSTTATDYEITRIVADDGEDGLSTQLYFAYADTDDGLNEANDANDSSFATDYFTDALYVGTDAVTYPAGTAVPTQSTDATTYEWSRLRGEDGITGPGGSANRIDIAYFADAVGTDPVYPTGTLAGGDYTLADRGTRQFQGTNVVTWIGGETEPAVSTAVVDYELTRIVADDGEDGLSTQLYFAYANTDDGLNEADDANDTSFATTYFEDALYVGTDAVTYTAGTTVPDQSTDATTYEWSRLRGEDGMSITGPGGSANRIDIAYFGAADGTDPSYPSGTLGGDDYTAAVRGTRNFQGTNVVTWIAGETEPVVSTTATDYEITQIVGIDGDNGDNGLSTQLYFAYANSADGATDFSITYFDDALFVGTDAITYVAGTTVPEQSTGNLDYEWSRLRGEDGSNGTSVLIIYASDAMGSDRSLTPGQGLDFVLYHEYVGTAPDIADVTGTWVSFVGADGILGQSVFPIYAEDSSGSNPSLTPTAATTFITFFESQETPVIGVTDLSGQTWVEYVGQGANLFIRLHENIITNDPGAPTGADGLGGGWYDPNGTVPTDPNPHWEARGIGEIIEGSPIVYDFDVDGLGGGVSTANVASAQDHDFVFSGSIGEEVVSIPASPTITNFDFGGQASEIALSTGGRPETWNVAVTGISDPTGSTSNPTSEEFFIYLAGQSGSGETITTFTPGTNTFPLIPNETGSANALSYHITLPETFDISSQAATGFRFSGQRASASTGQPFGDDVFPWNFSGVTFAFANATTREEFAENLVGIGLSDVGPLPSARFTEASVTDTGVAFTIRATGDIGLLSGIVGIATDNQSALNLITPTPIITDAIETTVTEELSVVNVSVPTENPSISETFTLSASLSGTTALRDDLLTMIQSNTNITAEFTASADVASGLLNVSDGEPIVRLVANDTRDHSLVVSFTPGGGDLTGSQFGTIVEGVGNTTSTAIRITYDSDLTPSFQDIAFGETTSSSDTAATLAAAINGHSELLATSSGSNVTITTAVNGVFETDPVIVVTSDGTTLDVPTFTVTNTQDGIADIPQQGVFTSYQITVDDVQVATGNFTSAASATAAALIIRTAINGLSTHSAIVDGTDDTLVLATSVANGPDNIEVLIVQGTNSPTGTSPNNLFVTRTISQTGLANDIFVGEDAMVTLAVEGVMYETHNVSGMSLSEIATLVAARFNAHPDSFFTAFASVNEVSVLNDAVGISNTPSVTVVAGILPTGVAATFTVDTIVNNSGVTTTITGGQLSSYSISVGGEERVTGNFSDSPSAIIAAGELVTALIGIPEYVGSVDMTDQSILVATASLSGTATPEITISITAGLLPDDTAATLSVTRTLSQAGVDETITFANTEWSYFVINQEIRVDDDTITMMDNNSLAVNRGLILDTQVWDDISNVAGPNVGNAADLEIAYLTESFTTQGRPSLAVVTLTTLTTGIVSFGAAAEDTLGYQLEFSVDNGQTWTLAVSSFAFRIAQTFSGTNYQSVLPVNFSSAFTLTPETTYWLRVVRVIRRSGAVITNPTTNINANFLVNLLAVEELLA